MRIANVKMMREIDKAAIEKIGIPSLVLMENAALAVLRHIPKAAGYVVVLAGEGNNGGDGFALARHLFSMGRDVDVFILSNEGKFKEDPGIHFQVLKNLAIPHEFLRDTESLWSFKEAVSDADLVVDAVFGTGLTRMLSRHYREVFGIVNDFSRYTLAVDVPSGLHGDSGKVMGAAIRAHKTVTFQCYKRGFLRYEALPYLGEVVVENIGIPQMVEERFDRREYLVEEHEVRQLVPKRERTGFKGSYGRVLMVAGSEGFTGAALLSGEAAIATGSGLVTLCSHEDTLRVLVPRLKEIMSLFPQGIEGGASRADVVAFGPGLGNTEATLDLLLRVLKTLEEEKNGHVLVLDADGLNVLEGRTDILKPLSFHVVLTPHLGEMARLTGRTVEDIQEHRVDMAREFAKEHGVVVVLKGYNTIVTDGQEVYVNPTGSSAMAQGGMGDVLTGIIASLAGQGIPPLEAAILGVYLHGRIGDHLTGERYTVKASEVIEAIPRHLKMLMD